jgi:hypothetical protein
LVKLPDPPDSPLDTLRAALHKERRSNKRLRAIIDELREQVRTIQNHLDVQFHRIAQLQVELDDTKRKLSTRP